MTRKLTDRELSIEQISRETGLSRSAIFWRAVKYGESSPLVGHAARRGWPLEAALTAPARRKRCFTDHKGNIFYSRAEMLKYWGVPRRRYYQEAAADVPLREILEKFGSKNDA